MAEKEEKTKDIIYVFSQQLICKDCKDWYEHIDPLDKPDCDNCEDIADLPHISRQEAIEKMAKARYTQRPCYDKRGNEISFEDAKENYSLFYEDLCKEVEPLLNALLEEK